MLRHGFLKLAPSKLMGKWEQEETLRVDTRRNNQRSMGNCTVVTAHLQLVYSDRMSLCVLAVSQLTRVLVQNKSSSRLHPIVFEGNDW